MIYNLESISLLCIICRQTAHDIKLESKGKKIDDDPALKEKFSKYLDYIDFQKHVKYVQPHQILAINRGESQKFLSVKINVSDSLWDSLKRNCTAKWLSKGIDSPFRRQIIAESLNDAIHRLCKFLLQLQKFCKNLRNRDFNFFPRNSIPDVGSPNSSTAERKRRKRIDQCVCR